MDQLKDKTIMDRAFKAINLKQFSKRNVFDRVDKVDIVCSLHRQYILRMCVKRLFDSYKIPKELKWLYPMLLRAESHQNWLGIHQPYCYITVRHGIVESETDDEWHVDGFSTNITHLPEQNYIWSNIFPTEYVIKPLNIPSDFSSRKHNIQWFIQDSMSTIDKVQTFEEETIYCLDPYIIHRRPKVPEGVRRTFVRISYTPIEIADDNNTPNPLLSIGKYNREGVKDFRNNLIRYKS